MHRVTPEATRHFGASFCFQQASGAGAGTGTDSSSIGCKKKAQLFTGSASSLFQHSHKTVADKQTGKHTLYTFQFRFRLRVTIRFSTTLIDPCGRGGAPIMIINIRSILFHALPLTLLN